MLAWYEHYLKKLIPLKTIKEMQIFSHNFFISEIKYLTWKQSSKLTIYGAYWVSQPFIKLCQYSKSLFSRIILRRKMSADNRCKEVVLRHNGKGLKLHWLTEQINYPIYPYKSSSTANSTNTEEGLIFWLNNDACLKMQCYKGMSMTWGSCFHSRFDSSPGALPFPVSSISPFAPWHH